MSNQDDHKTHSQVNEFDGIVENNYPMPGWWTWSFLFTMMFGGLYFLHMSAGIGEDSFTEHSRLEKEHFQKFPAPKETSISKSEILALLGGQGHEQQGQEVYVRVCQSCHAAQLQGLVGPNLTDRFWIQGQGRPHEIYNVIMNGVVAKGMPAWSAILKKEEVLSLVKFVRAAQGSNPANPKAPQGQEVIDVK